MRFNPGLFITLEVCNKRYTETDSRDFLLAFLDLVNKYKAASFDENIADGEHGLAPGRLLFDGLLHEILHQIGNIEAIFAFTYQPHRGLFH